MGQSRSRCWSRVHLREKGNRREKEEPSCARQSTNGKVGLYVVASLRTVKHANRASTDAGQARINQATEATQTPVSSDGVTGSVLNTTKSSDSSNNP